ncbi:MAG: hypothetical protein HYU02_02815, partial [Thaumarchaeota archaeon]|nr:hypothetical protein [Nitrososphaerota archaeon]
GVVAAFALPQGLTGSPTQNTPPGSSQLGTSEILLIAVAISAVSIVIAVVAIIASRRRKSVINNAQIHIRDRDSSSAGKK